MKRLKNQISKITSKKSKTEIKIHPIQLVFNYINNYKTFHNASLVCKEWKNILDTHNFWQEICKKLGYEEPKSKSKKYKTYKSIFVKNIDKLCHCEKNISLVKTLEIHFKLTILKEYCDNRLEYKVYSHYPYKNFVLFVQRKIEKLITKLDTNNNFMICDDCKIIFLKSIDSLKDKIYEKKRNYEKNLKSKKFCDFIKTDFVKIIIRNFYNILNNRSLYIERFGGIIHSYNHPIIYNVEY